MFIKEIRRSGVDGVVIGKIGELLVRESGIKNNIAYFELDDDKPNWDYVSKITQELLKYRKITIYYGQFGSIFSQIPKKSDITAEPEIKINPDHKPDKKFIFEPSPEEIYKFFREEITAAQFHQKIYESQLARYAARMITMDEATRFADQMLDQLNRKQSLVKRRKYNQEQLETIYRYKLINK